MSFHNIRFPEQISFGATGGPSRKVEVVTLANGYEERNQAWQRSKRSYNAGSGIKTLDDLHMIVAFFEARGGMQHGFRWKDWTDYKSAMPSADISCLDQEIGRGDGESKKFQLVKTYHSGDEGEARMITKPIAETVFIAVDGAALDLGEGFFLNATKGEVELEKAPKTGALITAGFEFDVPVRFDIDQLSVTASHFHSGEIPSIPLIEIFE